MASPSVKRVGYILPTEGEPRLRRARNAVTAGTGTVLLLVALAASVTPGSLQQSVDDTIARLPAWSEVVFWVGFGAAGVFAVIVLAALLLRLRRDPLPARDVLLAAGLTVAVSLVLMLWLQGAGPRLLPEFGAAEPVRQFPVLRLALVTTITLAAAPYLTTVVRRFGLLMIVLVAVSSLGLGFGLPSDALAAIGLGMAASGSVLLVFGSPSGFPPVDVVASALAQIGVRVHGLELAPDQSWGIRRFVGQDDDGQVVEVKAYGKDASDAQIAARLWRAVWYRGTTDGAPFTRMQAVEHEALMVFFAARAGVHTVEPLAAARAGDDVALLAVRRPGVPLSTLDPTEVSDTALTSIWRDVAALHAAGLVHGSLTPTAVTMVDGSHVLGDFTDGALALDPAPRLDVATLLYTLAALVGADRAVATAQAGLGDEDLAATLPYLQLPAVAREARGAAEAPKELMKGLRAAVADATGVEPPEPVNLRRVSFSQLLTLGLVLFAASALLSQLGDIDFAAVWLIVQDARWALLLVALPISQLAFAAEAGAMMAAVGRALPRHPLILLQVAARFIGLAVPSAAGRVAMNSAFLVKFGITPAIAVVQGAVDGVAGFVVEIVLLAVALLLFDYDLALSADINWVLVLLALALVAAAAAAAALFVERFRAAVVPVLREAVSSVSAVLADPRRALRLLSNNLLARGVLGVTLWLILRGVGGGAEISLAVALTVTVATNLLAGLVPVPGGIGVAEAVMTSWLVLVGVPEEEAFAATVIYRLWTFYLPSLEGVVAMRWLERNDYL